MLSILPILLPMIGGMFYIKISEVKEEKKRHRGKCKMNDNVDDYVVPQMVQSQMFDKEGTLRNQLCMMLEERL